MLINVDIYYKESFQYSNNITITKIAITIINSNIKIYF